MDETIHIEETVPATGVRALVARFIEAFAWAKVFFLQANIYFTVPSTFLIYIMALHDFYEPIAALGVPMPFIYVGVCLLALTCGLGLGFFNWRYVSQHEQGIAYKKTQVAYNASVKTDEIHQNVALLVDKIDKLQKEIEDLKKQKQETKNDK